MLETSQPAAFLPSGDLGRSERFFHGVLDLPVVSWSDFALVVGCAGTTLRVTRVEQLRTQPFTVFGWLVADLRSVVERLGDAGIAMVRHDGLDQDDVGVWTTSNGDQVAWFPDPDGNVLSVTELAA